MLQNVFYFNIYILKQKPIILHGHVYQYYFFLYVLLNSFSSYLSIYLYFYPSIHLSIYLNI